MTMFNTNGDPDRPLRVALYARVSSEEQKQGQNIKTQAEFAGRYCELNGLNLVAQYLDEAISGTVPLDKRPIGIDMLEAAREKNRSAAISARELAWEMACVLSSGRRMKWVHRVEGECGPWPAFSPPGRPSNLATKPVVRAVNRLWTRANSRALDKLGRRKHSLQSRAIGSKPKKPSARERKPS